MLSAGIHGPECFSSHKVMYHVHCTMCYILESWVEPLQGSACTCLMVQVAKVNMFQLFR